jgi:hypothetical protein
MLWFLLFQLLHKNIVDALWFDTLLPISTPTNVILLLHKKFESISKIAWAQVIMSDGNVEVVQVDNTVPPSLFSTKAEQ